DLAALSRSRADPRLHGGNPRLVDAGARRLPAGHGRHRHDRRRPPPRKAPPDLTAPQPRAPTHTGGSPEPWVPAHTGCSRGPAVRGRRDTIERVGVLTSEQRVEGYAWMALTRAFDDAMVAMWKQGRGLGGAFSQRGHEAISVAAGMALGPDDVAAPMHRDLGTYLVRGMTPDRIFGNLLGRATGPTRGRDANLHGVGDLSLGIVGFISHIPQALPTTLGVAMAFKMRRQPRVALTTVGDGGFTSGATHETLNMASLYGAPFVLIVEDNKYAYSTPLDQQMRTPRFAEKAAAYDIPTAQVDGNDFDAVYSAVSAA